MLTFNASDLLVIHTCITSVRYCANAGRESMQRRTSVHPTLPSSIPPCIYLSMLMRTSSLKLPLILPNSFSFSLSLPLLSSPLYLSIIPSLSPSLFHPLYLSISLRLVLTISLSTLSLPFTPP